METLATALPWIQIILAIILISLILLQRGEAALGAALGGASSENIKRTKRGAEKIIFNATIVIATIFALSALLALFIS